MSTSNYGSTFYFNGVLYYAQVLGFPELSMGERNTTNHGSGGWEERRPNKLNSAGDFTMKILSDSVNVAALEAARKAGTEATCVLCNPVNQYSFTGWVKSIKEDDADSEKPNNVAALITVTPIGEITIEATDDDPSS